MRTAPGWGLQPTFSSFLAQWGGEGRGQQSHMAKQLSLPYFLFAHASGAPQVLLESSVLHLAAILSSDNGFHSPLDQDSAD